MVKIHIHRPTSLSLHEGKLQAWATTTPWEKTSKSSSSKKKGPPPAPPACSICQEPVGVPTPDGITESWAALPCGHRFGSACIKTWLGMADQPSCPICRVSMEHTCKHPVLPVVVAPIPSGDTFFTPTSPVSRSSSFASGPASPPAWRGRDLQGMCGFCTVQRKSWPWRLAVRFVGLLARRRKRRRAAHQHGIQQPAVYSEDEDPWAAAFMAWWDLQEPKGSPTPEAAASA